MTAPLTYDYDPMFPLWRVRLDGWEIATLEQFQWEALVSYGTDLKRARRFFSTATAKEWLEENAKDLLDLETRDYA